MRILVVDDEEIKRVSLVDDLIEAGHQVTAAGDGAEALRRLAEEHFDVVVTDLRMPRIDGMEILRHVKRQIPETEVVMMTAYGSIPLAVEAMKRGAYNFIAKPFRNDTLLPLLERIQEDRDGECRGMGILPVNHGQDARATKKTGEAAALERMIVGRSKLMGDVRKMVDLCSRNDVTVLLIGETGTGKDLAAQTIHDLSARRSGPFVKVNCSSFPQHLMESGLFGHAKGSFTGADHPSSGKFDLAQGGTLYLDDVDDIPLEHQIKLLRVIEEKVYEKVGSPNPIRADVRLIASTKQNLLEEMEKGAFRSDLYYRLNVLRIELPPLRAHLEDLPELTHHLLDKITNGRDYRMSEDAVKMLMYHKWPGNVRELANALERAYLTGNGMIAGVLDAEQDIRSAGSVVAAATGQFEETVRQAERELLQRALKQAHGNKSGAARILGMKLSTFRDKLAKHGLA